MGTDNETREFALYFGDQRIGTLSELENLPVIEPQGEIEQVVKRPRTSPSRPPHGNAAGAGNASSS